MADDYDPASRLFSFQVFDLGDGLTPEQHEEIAKIIGPHDRLDEFLKRLDYLVSFYSGREDHKGPSKPRRPAVGDSRIPDKARAKEQIEKVLRWATRLEQSLPLAGPHVDERIEQGGGALLMACLLEAVLDGRPGIQQARRLVKELEGFHRLLLVELDRLLGREPATVPEAVNRLVQALHRLCKMNAARPRERGWRLSLARECARAFEAILGCQPTAWVDDLYRETTTPSPFIGVLMAALGISAYHAEKLGLVAIKK